METMTGAQIRMCSLLKIGGKTSALTEKRICPCGHTQNMAGNMENLD